MTINNLASTLPPTYADLAARFPLETVELSIGDRLWQVTCVTDQDALLDGVNEVEHVPYGFLLWESAVMLASWLTGRAETLRGKRILELGAGVGLSGLVASYLGAQVWQTDHRADVLVLAQHNAQVNGGLAPHQFVADWRAWTHAVQYDLLLGADILYERAMHEYLLPIFEHNLVSGGTLVLTDPSRPQALDLITAMEDAGWQIEIEMQTLTLPLLQRMVTPVNVALLACRR